MSFNHRYMKLHLVTRIKNTYQRLSKIDKTMIAQNATACTTKQLIEQLDNCTDSSTLNYILDKKEYMQFISSFLWGAAHKMIIQVCGSLIGELIYDELLRKQKEKIKYTNQGFQMMKIL